MGGAAQMTEIEQHFMWEVVRHGEKVAGGTLWTDYCARTKKNVAVGQTYATLDRMQRKGFLTSEFEDAVAADGRRRKIRYFRVTEQGKKVLREIQSTWNALTEGVSLAT